MRRVAWLTLIVTVALGGDDRRGAADEPPAPARRPTVKEAVEQVLAAVAAGDEATLKTLARGEEPDPWLVADSLLAQAKEGAALAYARAGQGKDTERLGDYVAAARGQGDGAEARGALASAKAQLSSGDAQGAVQTLDGATFEEGTVLAVHAAHLRGTALSRAGRPEEGALVFAGAADAAERMGWLSRASYELSEAGRSAWSGGDYPAAKRLVERRVALERVRGNVVDLAIAQGHLALLHYSLGDFAEALRLYREVVVVLEAFPDRRAVGTNRLGVANVLVAMGEYDQAREEYGRAIADFEAAKDRSGLARVWGNLGALRDMVGDVSGALEAFGRSREEALASGNAAAATSTLVNLGVLRKNLGDYAAAFQAFEQALSEATKQGDRRTVAAALVEIAVLDDALGRHREAIARFEAALPELERIGRRPDVAAVLGNIGSVLQDLKEYDKALEFQRRALAEKEAIADRAGAAVTLGNLGSLHDLMGNREAARAAYAKALAEAEALGDAMLGATTLQNLGLHLRASGEHERALEHFTRALAQFQTLGNRAAQVGAHAAIARTLELLGRPTEAVKEARSGVGILTTLFAGLGDEQGAVAREQHGRLFAVGVRAAADLGDPEEVAWFLERGRAGSLLESFGAQRALRAAVLPPDLVKAEGVTRLKEVAASRAYREALQSGKRESLRSLRAALRDAQEESIAVAERVQREAKRGASVVQPEFTSLADVQATLAPAEALVLYAFAETRALALVVTREGLRIAPLRPPDTIQQAVAALALSTPSGEVEGALAALRQALVDPLALGTDVRRVVVSPEGVLNYVPFSLLLGGRDVCLVPSATTLRLLRAESSGRGVGVLAVGDPDYGVRAAERSESAVRAGGRLLPLPATRTEVEAVGDVRLLGPEAAESAFLQAVAGRERWRAVHLACHGLADAELPAYCSLALTADENSDGFLTALEVFQSRIPADLVVLSACETGRGRVVGGEGLVGLARAFMFAGAPRVLCSLWKVDDEATLALMKKFYELWNPKAPAQGMDTAAALRAAQEHLRSHEKWKHPYYWAAWVLWGLPT